MSGKGTGNQAEEILYLLFKLEKLEASPSQDKPTGTTRGYPEPLVIYPSTSHTHSIILLHGRGSNAALFGLEFLNSKTSTGKTLRELFTGAKFVFPTAKKRRAAIFKRMPINQWFDNYSLDDPTHRQELQYDGLRETSIFVHELIREEAKAVGLHNIVIGGLSQGCAMSLHISLNYAPGSMERSADQKSSQGGALSLGGFVGMSGWLPFSKDLDLAAILSERSEHDEDYLNPFRSADDSDCEEKGDDSMQARQLRVANFARDVVDLGPLDRDEHSKPCFAYMPYFLGHGTADEKVPVHLGEQAKDLLLQLGLVVTWKSYQDFGHWYKEPDEIDDISRFLQEKVGMKITELI